MIIVPCLFLLCLVPAKILDFTVCVFQPESPLITHFNKPYSSVEEFTVESLIVLVLEVITSTDMMGTLKLASLMFYSFGFLRKRENIF